LAVRIHAVSWLELHCCAQVNVERHVNLQSFRYKVLEILYSIRSLKIHHIHRGNVQSLGLREAASINHPEAGRTGHL